MKIQIKGLWIVFFIQQSHFPERNKVCVRQTLMISVLYSMIYGVNENVPFRHHDSWLSAC